MWIDLGLVANGFDIVAIGVQYKGAVVIFMVMRAQTGLSIIFATCCDGGGVERVNTCPALCCEGEVERRFLGLSFF